jgi:hypothetical protein
MRSPERGVDANPNGLDPVVDSAQGEHGTKGEENLNAGTISQNLDEGAMKNCDLRSRLSAKEQLRMVSHLPAIV